jgi:hypothetical protein
VHVWPGSEWLLLGVAAAAPTDRLAVDTDLVVNEIFYRGDDTQLEFVELLNRSDKRVDLSSFQISDSRRKPVRIAEVTAWIEPGGHAVLVKSGEAFDNRFPFSNRIELAGWPTLNNSGDAVLLWQNGVVTDSVEYFASWGGNDVSLERLDPAGPSDVATNWAESIDRSGGTPGLVNSVFSRDEVAPRVIFCQEQIDGSLAVYFSEPIDPESVVPSAFQLDTGVFPVSAHLDESLQTAILQLETLKHAVQVIVRGVSDPSGNLVTPEEIDIAWLARTGDLVINEIMYEPLSDDFDGRPNQTEYVELIVRSDRPIALRGLELTGPIRENGHRDSTPLEGRRIALRRGSLVLVYALPNSGEDPLAAFEELPRSDPDLILMPIASRSLSFGNNGDTIRLALENGDEIDEVNYSPPWHLPERIDTRGVALERIAPNGPSTQPENWSSSVDPSGGTPGRRNSIESTPNPGPRSSVLTVTPSPFSPDADGFGDTVTITVNIDHPTGVLRAWIFDVGGRTIRELVQAAPVGQSSHWIWDGRNNEGELQNRGVYIVLVEVTNLRAGYLIRDKKPVVLYR